WSFSRATHDKMSAATDTVPAIRKPERGLSAALLYIFIRDSPDESQTGINVRVSSALLQDRREVLTATSTQVTRTLGRGSDLAIFPGIWTHSFCRLLLNA